MQHQGALYFILHVYFVTLFLRLLKQKQFWEGVGLTYLGKSVTGKIIIILHYYLVLGSKFGPWALYLNLMNGVSQKFYYLISDLFLINCHIYTYTYMFVHIITICTCINICCEYEPRRDFFFLQEGTEFLEGEELEKTRGQTAVVKEAIQKTTPEKPKVPRDSTMAVTAKVS